MTPKDQISNAIPFDMQESCEDFIGEPFDMQEDCERFVNNAITDARLAHGSAAANATTDRVIDKLKFMPAEYTAAFVRFAILAGVHIEQQRRAELGMEKSFGIAADFKSGAEGPF